MLRGRELGGRISTPQLAKQHLGLLPEMIETGTFGQLARHDSSCGPASAHGAKRRSMLG
jgi:hypothetical protein